jgi:DASH complex subunit DAM1
MLEFVDETEALQGNIEGMKNLSDSLATFNESFASWLYILNMNALTTDWPQTPTDASYHFANRRMQEDTLNALEAVKLAAFTNPKPREADQPGDRTSITDPETTFAANSTNNASGQASGKSGTTTKVKKAAKPKLTAKQKKERSIAIEKIISCLPLEFRGNDPVCSLISSPFLSTLNPPSFIRICVVI